MNYYNVIQMAAAGKQNIEIAKSAGLSTSQVRRILQQERINIEDARKAELRIDFERRKPYGITGLHAKITYGISDMKPLSYKYWKSKISNYLESKIKSVNVIVK